MFWICKLYYCIRSGKKIMKLMEESNEKRKLNITSCLPKYNLFSVSVLYPNTASFEFSNGIERTNGQNHSWIHVHYMAVYMLIASRSLANHTGKITICRHAQYHRMLFLIIFLYFINSLGKILNDGGSRSIIEGYDFFFFWKGTTEGRDSPPRFH
jgi:hypothetical protein